MSLERVENIWRLAALALIVASLVLTGCESKKPKRPPGYLGPAPANYVVRKGDTLYSIAFRYGLDYKKIAATNGIKPPYTIYIDQRLRLKGTRRAQVKDGGAVTRPKAPTSKPAVPAGPVKFAWPLKGEIIRPFSQSAPVNNGIDIAGKKGALVRAAADGVVVYAGGNLRGYGNLLILKHNDEYLSAYGNNAKMLVKEGEQVKAGGTIARVGVSEGKVSMLHFEIRRNGKPENPLRHLPKVR